MKKGIYFPSPRINLVYQKYQQLQKRIARAIQKGKFYQYSKTKQQQLLKRLERYLQQLNKVSIQLPNLVKRGTAAVALTSALLSTNLQTTHAQSFIQEGGTTPFGISAVSGNASPAFGDLDGDNDLDLLIGRDNGATEFFTNTGSSSSPAYSMSSTPPGLSAVNAQACPVFADFFTGDGGKLEAAIGGQDGFIIFFNNFTGSTSNPDFSTTGSFLPVSVGSNAAPTFVDIDGDGDLDLFSGNANGDILFFEDYTASGFPTFSTTPVTAPFGLSNVASNSAIAFVDIDGDMDFDAFVGAGDGSIQFYRNTGVSTAPAFSLDSSISIPNVGTNAKPTFVDIDGDGDFDAFVGNGAGQTLFFRNGPGVISNIQDDFNIMDPCSCADPQNTVVNGTFLFHDVLTVTAPTGQTVRVVAPNDGKFLAVNGTPISLPITLAETSTGVYQLDFWHRSGETTTVSVDLNGGTAMPFTSSLCNESDCVPIPTLSQWGLLILALLLLNLGLITVKQKEEILASIQQKE